MIKLIKKAKRILIIDLLYLGDLIFITPFLRNLRKNYPEARIDLIVNANFFEIIENNSYLDHVYAYNKRFSLKENIKFINQLNKNNYNLGLDLHGSLRSNILLRLINPDYTAMLSDKNREVFFDRILPLAQDRHMVDVYLQFLNDLGMTEIDREGLELTVDKEASYRMRKFLNREGVTEDDRLIGLNTGGSWPTKQWTKKGFAELADRLKREYGFKPIFFGGLSDLKRVNSIIEMMVTKPILATGKTDLKELTALAQSCDLFISGDTGPVHVAAAVGTPTITLFGPSDEKKYRPYGQKQRIIKKNLSCRPCGKHKCPLGDHRCMTEIRVDDVLNEVFFLLRG